MQERIPLLMRFEFRVTVTSVRGRFAALSRTLLRSME
jgi:hypothetical protein